MKSSRAIVVPVSAAHILAWVAFLWIVWPYSYERIVVTTGQHEVLGDPVETTGYEVVQYSSSFLKENGIGSVLYLFIPVVLTGLALMFLLTWKGRGLVSKLVLAGLAAVLLVFCGLGYLSYGIAYLPAALAIIVAAVACGLRPGPGKEQPQHSGS